MTLVGNGIVPIAHLDLPPSDYLTGARRAVELKTEPEHTLPTGAQLHVNTKVMEFTSHAQQPTARLVNDYSCTSSGLLQLSLSYYIFS